MTESSYEDVAAYVAARREQTGPPPGFRMYGETFVCRPLLDVGALLDFDVTLQSRGIVLAALDFLRAVLDDDSAERFEVLFADRARPVDDVMLTGAAELVMTSYTARPTKESSSSSTTRSKRGRNSKAGSSSPAPKLRSA